VQAFLQENKLLEVIHGYYTHDQIYQIYQIREKQQWPYVEASGVDAPVRSLNIKLGVSKLGFTGKK
jgi:hypothetical protein